ncbi:MAG TPA: lytic transglycosylase domain-containing protein [Anaerolineaceae bacterium]|nr:lytic transglycosylase domain-containing protein [Anaerolineaceae bacterium]
MLKVQDIFVPVVLFCVGLLVVATSLLSGPQVVVEAAPLSPMEQTVPAVLVQPTLPQPSPNAAVATAAAAPAAVTGSGCAVSSAYPESVRQWCDWIEQSAVEYSLDANLIAAVMLQESGGDPNAYSRSGAVGLMQVMPRDGLAASFMCNGQPCFAARPTMSELYDPEFNIAYGARMLSGLIGRRGSVREALFSYGPIGIGYDYADIVLRIYATYR